MAYKTEELKIKSLEAIKEHNLFFVEDLIAYIPCSKETFYNHKLHESDDIKEALYKNRVQTKNGLRSKWYKSENATMTVALYKLIADETERKKLSQQYTDITSGGEAVEYKIEVVDKRDADQDDTDTT